MGAKKKGGKKGKGKKGKKEEVKQEETGIVRLVLPARFAHTDNVGADIALKQSKYLVYFSPLLESMHLKGVVSMRQGVAL